MFTYNNQHMDTPHAFSNHVKETLNSGLSLSEVGCCDLKRETTHGLILMEVDWEGKIKPNHTTSESMLFEVDWGAHDSSFFFSSSTLTRMESQRTDSPKDCGEDYHREHLLPLSWST